MRVIRGVVLSLGAIFIWMPKVAATARECHEESAFDLYSENAAVQAAEDSYYEQRNTARGELCGSGGLASCEVDDSTLLTISSGDYFNACKGANGTVISYDRVLECSNPALALTYRNAHYCMAPTSNCEQAAPEDVVRQELDDFITGANQFGRACTGGVFNVQEKTSATIPSPSPTTPSAAPSITIKSSGTDSPVTTASGGGSLLSMVSLLASCVIATTVAMVLV